jgi:hypothetical protein
METDYPVYKHSSFKGLIGVARIDITPPVGIYSRNWGAAKHDTAKGIHRPLTLTCIIFQSEKKEKPLVLIAADLGWWKNAEDERTLRNKLLNALALSPSQLMFCLSHTHAGPGICSDDASSSGGEYIEPYLNLILKSAIRATEDAISTALPATLTWLYGKCALATNRDLAQPEKKRFIVGFNPEQEADDTLLVGRITNEQGHIFATIVNYACHPTTLAWDNDLISPDYVGSMREIVEHHTNATCLFLQGASGDLAPAKQYVGDIQLADAYGRQLGFAVLSTLEAMLPPKTQLSFSKAIESGAPLAIWEEHTCLPSTALSSEIVEVELPLKSLPSLSDIEQQWSECEDRVLKERLWRKRGVRKAVGDGYYARVGLWVWRLGGSILAGQPNEAYSQFQVELRRQFKGHAIGIMNVVNGHIGYLPPAKLYKEEMYSVWQTPFDVGSLEILIEKAIAAVKDQLGKSF